MGIMNDFSPPTRISRRCLYVMYQSTKINVAGLDKGFTMIANVLLETELTKNTFLYLKGNTPDLQNIL